MWEITRVSPEGYKGYKRFDSEAEAKEWLNSDSVKEDRDYGFMFWLKEVENK